MVDDTHYNSSLLPHTQLLGIAYSLTLQAQGIKLSKIIFDLGVGDGIGQGSYSPQYRHCDNNR